jgi:hypothetical protein
LIIPQRGGARIYEKQPEMEDGTHSPGALRDALLPNLMSGELHVKDAQKFIGRIAA